MKLRSSHLNAYYPFFLLLIALIQILFALTHSNNFGPSSDILWGLPQATAFMNSESYVKEYEINILGLKVPIATGPYQGGIKPIIAALWMKYVGSSYFKILLLNIVLSTFALSCLLWAINFSRFSSLLSIICIAFLNLHFILGSIMDYGPFLLQFAFVSISIGSTVRGIIQKKLSYFYISSFFLGLTLNEKITSLPIVTSILIFILGYITISDSLIKNKIKTLIFLLGYLTLGTLPYAIYFIKTGHLLIKSNAYGTEEIKINFIQSLKDACYSFFTTYNSAHFSLLKNWTALIELKSTPNIMYVPCIILALSLIILFKEKSIEEDLKKKALSIFVLSIFLLTIIFQALIPGLNRPWHNFTYYPLLALLFALLFESIKNFRLAKIFLFLVFVFLFFKQTIYLSKSYNILSKYQGENLYSPAMISFSDKLKELPKQRVAALSYSLADPIYVLTGGKVRIDDFTWWNPDDVRNTLLGDNSISYFIYRKPAPSTLPYDNLALGHVPLLSEINNFKIVFSIKDVAGTEFVLIERGYAK